MKYLMTLSVSLISLALATTSHAQLWQKKDIDKIATAIASKQMQAERDLYKAVPDPIKCKKFRWIEASKCSDLNFIMKKNPGAPMRMTAKNGLEVNIPPATPSAMIPFILDPTVENSVAVREFTTKVFKDVNEKSLKSKVVASIFENPKSPEYKSYEKPYNYSVNVDKVRITVLADPDSSDTSTLLEYMMDAKKSHPGLNVKAFYKTNSIDIAYLTKTYGINGRVMSPGEKHKAKVTEYPVVWIDSTAYSFRRSFSGVPTLPQILGTAEVVSNAHLANKLLEDNK